MEAWATALEALVAWAMDMAVAAAASTDFAMAVAMEAMDLALALEAMGMDWAAHHTMEGVDSLTSTRCITENRSREKPSIVFAHIPGLILKKSTLFSPSSID
ncbi:Hypothetical predicted protein [Marmota monax]|uniref:Uncharacterized protein n=1 Tax=Marmota monax TaxID=9995 RepID=A0A5E4C5Z3_MARMO|nr:Hypothetical predicted protein [Marmota monax]